MSSDAQVAHLTHIAAGHKANLHNPNTSEKSKEHSLEVLHNDLNDGNIKEHHEKNPKNVAGGLKAAIHNPNVSDEAKISAKVRLHQM
ncbi:conidiation protein 6 [Xylaria sp. FL1042]|nr:conidiation protein 6 [Xylaria sp. FL1042]